MGEQFYIKQRDTAPAIRFALEPSSIVLTGATVRFFMRNRAGQVVVDAAALIVTATGTPTVEYSWQPGDTAAAGLYEAEFQVTYADGKIETFPNVGYIQIRMEADIAETVSVATAPAIFTSDMWALADIPSMGGNTLLLTISALPSDGGSPITALQYRIGGGAVQTLFGTGTGARSITVLAGGPASIEVRAVNAIGDGAWSVAKTATPTVEEEGPIAAAVQGVVTFPYSGTTRTTGNSFDGSAFIVVPDGATVEMLDPTPAVASVDLSGTVYVISGVEINPRSGPTAGMNRPFDQRGAFNAAAMASFPATLSPGDSVIKAVSNPTLTVAQRRQGLSDSYAICHVLSQSQYVAMQADGGIETWLAPAPFGWTGRTEKVWRKVNMDALFALRPALSLSGISLPTSPTLAQTVARLDRFNPGLIGNDGTVESGYEAHSINSYGAQDTNYSPIIAQSVRHVAMHFLGTTARADIEPAIRRLVALGSWWFDYEEGQGTPVVPDGGHWQHLLIPMMMGLLATGRAARVANIGTVSPQNQLQQSRRLSVGDMAQLVPHDSTSGPHTYRRRVVHAISGTSVTVAVVAGADPFWNQFYGLECRRASDNALMGIVSGGSDIPTSSANSFRGVVTLDRTPTGLTTADLVYFAAPAGWLTEGTAVWAITGDMKNFNPSPRATYAPLSFWAGDTLFIRAMNLFSAQFAVMEDLIKGRVNSPTKPSAMIGAGGSIAETDAFGGTQYQGAINQFVEDLWTAHASSLSLGSSTATPANTAVPTISGTLTVGQTLTAGGDTWSNGPILAREYRWSRGSHEIAGATASTRVLSIEDSYRAMTVQVRAQNASGWSSWVSSAATALVAEGPVLWEMFEPHTNLIGRTLAVGAGMSQSLAASPVGVGGSVAVAVNGYPQSPEALFRFSGFTIPNPLADTDLLVTAWDAGDSPMDTGVTGGSFNLLSSFAYTVSPSATAAAFRPGLSHSASAGGLRWQALAVNGFRSGGWGGTKMSAATYPITGTLQTVPFGFAVNGQGTFKYGPTVRVMRAHKPAVVLSFDDQNSRQYTELFLSIMQPRGITGTMYTPFANIGGGARWTLAQAQEMKAAGWTFAQDSGVGGEPMTCHPSPADTLAILATNAASLISNGLSNAEDVKHFCYSFGPSSMPLSPITMTGQSSTGTTLLTSTSNYAGASVAAGMKIKGTGLPTPPTVVSINAASPGTTLVTDVALPTFTGQTLTFVGVASNIQVTCNGSATVTNMNTTGVIVGMAVQGRDVPAGTVVASIVTESPTVGVITLNNAVPSTTTRLTFFLADAPWLPGKFRDAAILAGFKSGVSTGLAGSGIFTAFGIDPKYAMQMSRLNHETQTTSTRAIADYTAILGNGQDLHIGSHWANSMGASEAAAGVEVFDWLIARRNAGEIDLLSITEWHARASARSFA